MTRGLLTAGVAALACGVAACQETPRTYPVMSLEQFYKLPPEQRPTMFRDPNPNLGYPYNIHETDGLSRNPDDCMRWGCIDNNRR